jgi:hypothetical protein
MISKLSLAGLCAVVIALAPAASAAPRQAPPSNILITSASDFDEEHGVSSGSGTSSDPYVIRGLQINILRIENTSKYLEITRNTIAGQLILDWAGDRLNVTENRVGDLRVNRNVARTGLPSSGTITHNTFGVVGQLRHWDGTFAHNVVGFKDRLNDQAVNFDGFNGSRFLSNTIYGFVVARLHGHHHSSAYGDPSHMHASHSDDVDHSQRYHSVLISGNLIRTTHEFALQYTDTNHAANDRTAPSETNKDLNLPHAHHTRVGLTNNVLQGAGILVNVFNADDPKHKDTYRGSFTIDGNRISLAKDDFFSFRQLIGIDVMNAKDLNLAITRNTVRGQRVSGPFAFLEQWDSNAGIFLRTLDLGRVMVAHNTVTNRVYGVRAENFTKTVRWTIRDLATANVQDAESYSNVPNEPA